MANKVFPNGKKHLATDVNWTGDTIKLVAIDLADYTYDETDEFLSDIAAGAREETSGALSGKTATVIVDAGGDDYVVLDATDVTLTAASGDPIEAFIIIKDTGSAATSPVLSFHDRDPSNNAISVVLNGGDVNIAFSDPNGIIKLG